MSWYLKCKKNYTNFKGRARRKEYWIFQLINIIFLLFLYILDLKLNTGTIINNRYIGFFSFIYEIFILLPTLSVTVRRLHDIGRSGSWIFISFIPIVGVIWLIILMCVEGSVFDNEYGSNPKDENQSESYINK